MEKLKEWLDQKFKIKDLGILHSFLAIEVIHHEEGFILTQKKFTLHLIKEFNCENCSPASSPLVPGLKLTPVMDELLIEPSAYWRLIRKLNYLTNTRLDLAFSVQHLSQFMAASYTAHFNATLHVLKYLKTNLSQGIYMNSNHIFQLQAFYNSDWASYP